MEDRLSRPRAVRPGAASLALLVILLVTAAWWALALWPAGAAEPLWLVRTRAVCFGSAPGGLPDAGGWILLVGEPAGMLVALFTVWGGALRRDLRQLAGSPLWRAALLAVPVLIVVGGVAAARRVAYGAGLSVPEPGASAGLPHRVNLDVSAVALVDQQGRRASLADWAPRGALLTFAFAHCATVCPTIVHDLRSARRQAGRPELPLLIITLDPWRDTPERLAGMAEGWQLEAPDRVLSGSVADVQDALDLLRVGRSRDTRTGDLEHAATVMLLDRRGHVVWRLDGGWGRAAELISRAR